MKGGIEQILFYLHRMSDSAISGYVALAMSIATAVVGIVNHKRIRSTCCGHKAEASLDIEVTTPPELKLKLPPNVEDKSSTDAVS